LQNSGVVEQSSYIVEVSDGLSLPSKLVTGFYNNLYIHQIDSSGYPTSRLVRWSCPSGSPGSLSWLPL